jgi:hypothetical protein
VQAKETEDKYFEEGFNALHGTGKSSQKKRRFNHFESQFDKHGETVLIWSLKEFSRNKDFSESTFAKYHDAERRKRVRMRREGGEGNSGGGGGGDSYAVPTLSRKALWEQSKRRFEDWLQAKVRERQRQGQDDGAWLVSFTTKAQAAKKR